MPAQILRQPVLASLIEARELQTAQQNLLEDFHLECEPPAQQFQLLFGIQDDNRSP